MSTALAEVAYKLDHLDSRAAPQKSIEAIGA
jgi:hypothetical protein